MNLKHETIFEISVTLNNTNKFKIINRFFVTKIYCNYWKISFRFQNITLNYKLHKELEFLFNHHQNHFFKISGIYFQKSSFNKN